MSYLKYNKELDKLNDLLRILRCCDLKPSKQVEKTVRQIKKDRCKHRLSVLNAVLAEFLLSKMVNKEVL